MKLEEINQITKDMEKIKKFISQYDSTINMNGIIWKEAQKELLNEMIIEYELIEINVSDWLNEKKRKISIN